MSTLQETVTRLAGRVRSGDIPKTAIDRIALTGNDDSLPHDTAEVLVLWGWALRIGAQGLCRLIVDELARQRY